MLLTYMCHDIIYIYIACNIINKSYSNPLQGFDVVKNNENYLISVDVY